MAPIPFPPSNPNTPNSSRSTPRHSKSRNKKSRTVKKRTKTPSPPPPPAQTSSWEHFKNLLSCKNTNNAESVHSPVKKTSKKYTKIRSTCGAVRDAVHGNTTSRVTDQGSNSDGGSHANETTPLSVRSGRGAQVLTSSRLMKLSGCYECHAVDVHSASRRYPRPRTLCPCTECEEVFTKPESLEIHQAIQHAVSELGAEDSSRNIVEIIFKSSWLTKHSQICTVDRILKVHNTQTTTSRFERYRDSVKIQAYHPAKNSSKNPRCAADGNELLRFYSTSIACALGCNASASLCLSSNLSQPCGVCRAIRHGLEPEDERVGTYASSGRAHERGPRTDGRVRAMLVCRVIAGKVGRVGTDDVEGFDSFAKDGGMEDLFVDNPRAILPCFVVVYHS